MTSLLAASVDRRHRRSGPATSADPPAAVLDGTAAEDLVLAVAPSTGRFHPAARGRAEAGTVLGHVTGGRGRADAITAPVAGEVAGVLARPGQLVRRGQALVWLRRAVAA